MFGWLRGKTKSENIDDEEWQNWTPQNVVQTPSFAIFERVHVKGTSHRRSAALKVIDFATRCEEAGFQVEMDLIREPQNSHDPNAVMVLGAVDEKTMEHFGYIPATTAENIANSFPKTMPLKARLSQVSYLGPKLAIFIEVLRPSKNSAWWKLNMD